MGTSTASAPEPQSSAAVLMVRPAGFAGNPQTASTNAFQQGSGAEDPEVTAAARREFDGLAEQLQRAGVTAIVGEDTPLPPKPDAVFPNNWVSFHADGTVVLYPMFAANRRRERRQELVELAARAAGGSIARLVDLSPHEAAARFLEGTGSLVLDRTHRVAYASLSARTHAGVLAEWAAALGYEAMPFEAFDAAGSPVYHTNVVMAVGTAFAVLCSAAIADERRRAAVQARLEAGGHDVVDITPEQLACFCGNVLELRPPAGPVIALSSTAWEAFDAAQRRRLERRGRVLVADIPCIERHGGGGVRCMLAEVHLPKRAQPRMS